MGMKRVKFDSISNYEPNLKLDGYNSYYYKDREENMFCKDFNFSNSITTTEVKVFDNDINCVSVRKLNMNQATAIPVKNETELIEGIKKLHTSLNYPVPENLEYPVKVIKEDNIKSIPTFLELVNYNSMSDCYNFHYNELNYITIKIVKGTAFEIDFNFVRGYFTLNQEVNDIIRSFLFRAKIKESEYLEIIEFINKHRNN